MLTQGAVTKVDDADYEWVSRYNWYLQSKGYAARKRRKSDGPGSGMVLLHREVLSAMGIDLTDRECDHKNRCRLDNRRCNLRAVTQQQNHCNKSKQRNSSSGYIGVTWHSRDKVWHAQVRCNGKRYHLGCFTSSVAAAKAYDRAALELHGKYATTNFAYNVAGQVYQEMLPGFEPTT